MTILGVTNKSVELVCSILVLLLAQVAVQAQVETEQDRLLARFKKAAAAEERGEWKAAENEYHQLLKLIPETYGANSAAEASVTRSLAQIYKNTDRWNEAQVLYSTVLKNYRAVLGNVHPVVSKTLNAMADVHVAKAEFEKAEQIYQESLEICRRCEQSGTSELGVIGQTYNGLAVLYAQTGRLQLADEMYQKCLTDCEKAFGDQDFRTAQVHSNIGVQHLESFDFASAEASFRKALAIHFALGDKGSLGTAVLFSNLGVLHSMRGDYANAAEAFQTSLRIHQQLTPGGSLVMSQILRAYADVMNHTQRPGEAKRLLEDVLSMQESILDQSHPELANTLAILGTTLIYAHEYAAAEKILRRGLQATSSASATNRERLTLRHNLAWALQFQGAFEEALRLEEQCALEWSNGAAGSHPFFEIAANNVGILQRSLNRLEDSLRSFQQSRQAAFKHIANTLPWMSESEQLKYLKIADRVPLHLAVLWAVQQPDNELVKQMTHEWVLNSKAASEFAQSQTLARLRSASAPELSQLRKDQVETIQQLTRLSLIRQETESESVRGNLESKLRELSGHQQEVTLKIHALDGNTAARRQWITQAELRKRLAEDAAYIELFRLDVHESVLAQHKDAQYLAWVVTRDAVELILLGNAPRLDEKIAAIRRVLQDAPSQIDRDGDVAAEQDFLKTQQSLSELIISPLQKLAGNKRRWIIAPDGDTWLLPWQALTDDQGKYMIESHSVQLVTAAVHLLSSPTAPSGPTGVPVVISNPEYDAQITPTEEGTQERGTRSLSADLSLTDLQPLPGTGIEARHIAKAFSQLYQQSSVSYSGKDSTAQRLLGLQRPIALSIGTHGFYLPSQPVDSQAMMSLNSTSKVAGLEDPMMRCGLLLAGCNASGPNRLAGVVTGKDILTLDLGGCELVILSCCETAVGEVMSGDGVVSLQRAFHLAGAQSIIASLWRISDQSNVELIEGFSQQLINKTGHVEALAKAQRAMIARLRQQKQAAHPYHWAALAITTNKPD